ncbi:MAG: DNA mismatch repair endonuclease MutL [Nanoarchaeota archaeon]|nr:DNA mismatch repair endonuclease MutL [Nanoarchaeota archaeon]MBU4242558.1 DNA mismatch repair endonuclease MutL [Nanoarchaeota archaeon]MBU4352537.1 DNA mismatch repair endonuclease MutL [Nanoarchaeota archaeon]MBU4456890.1 DNA mismatch repair endonuclease MutL [Nanoarchaeota archaeon]MCG2719839.1 DNA mismatch repair endonuclease MutL [Nanoarchaeota archaeon]
MIKLLEDTIINKIAAGEVIERPASVVKELMENAIDAKATIIEIDVKNYGKDLIRVVDNGLGMNKEDTELSIQRHATSKISSEEDLTSINTLGFRGEALASIAAVSKMTILTKEKDKLEGFKISLEGGDIITKGTIGCKTGTTIEVQDLFFNTPARLKFLKTESNELKNIVDIVSRYALFYNNISFKLIHNGHLLINTNSSENALNNIISIYGSETSKHLMNVNYENNSIKISGFISKPSLLKPNKSFQNIYVNGRYVKNETMQEALYDAYHSLLFVNMHPVTILNIEINPKEIDVNVHPTKDLVKFAEATKIYDAVFNALRKTLQENNLITDYTHVDQQMTFSGKRETFNQIRELGSNGIQSQLMVEEKKILSKLPNMRLLGQIAKTYFLAESQEGFLIIDQHVVQERILYEKFMKQLLNNNVARQVLVKPELIELSPEEKIIVLEKIQELNSLGFELEEFGGNSFMLRVVPTLFNKVQTKDLLLSVLHEIQESKRSSLNDIQESIITRMACRASIKAGDNCSIPQMEMLLEQLDKTELPWTCPHGRPIIIKFSKDEIEKMFKRKA